MARLIRTTPVTPPRTRGAIRAGRVIGAALGIVCGSAGIAGDAAGTRGSFDVAGVVVGAPVAGVGGCVQSVQELWEEHVSHAYSSDGAAIISSEEDDARILLEVVRSRRMDIAHAIHRAWWKALGRNCVLMMLDLT
eukprot:CAMPEP_0201951638 /NCGR_PEP_ID=MMETSP0904-20121228/582_1 /ASSEMBLY_ACC=CAM_ASM_000553 /TAXON_ID=420261 /ORGANISM="Thalassiosira antarctica, Strain CCMP982" /LENGTH=135 /DNA_ID=CAMNT_0048495117 /DNA_START=106 /DNA_END=514 /DNA_ORIENTATION=-